MPLANGDAMADVILDVDTGLDDALALLLAASHLRARLLAVTCVAGNTDVDQVVRNTLTVLGIAGAHDVPVARGADRPLLAPRRKPSHVHGPDGLAGLALPPPTGCAVAEHAVELMRQKILGAQRPVTLISTAPLTNIALLLRTYPEVGNHLDRIVFMGGSAGGGNATPAAEFNAWTDPEAMAVVLGCSVPATMYGLDVFYEVCVTDTEAAAWAASERTAVRLAGRLLGQLALADSGESRIPLGSGATIGDAGAVCAVIDPAGLTTQALPVQVCLSEGPARGQTVVDRRTTPGEGADVGPENGRPVDVAIAVDRDRYRRLFLAAIEGIPG